jgi:ATP-binding cassette, subfamily B, bacterial
MSVHRVGRRRLPGGSRPRPPSRPLPLARLRRRQQWRFLAALLRADPALAVGWWLVLAGRGVLPAVFAVATGALVGAVQAGAT